MVMNEEEVEIIVEAARQLIVYLDGDPGDMPPREAVEGCLDRARNVINAYDMIKEMEIEDAHGPVV